MEFSKLNISSELMRGLNDLGFEKPTEIQNSCIPEILNGHDVVGQSLTGSGKTAAFSIPILNNVKKEQGIQALILTPTRELCEQVRNNIESIGKYTKINVTSIFGGVGYGRQLSEIRTAEIVVATPGRLIDHLDQGNIKFDKIKYVVLDEADIMIDMGFARDVEKILSKTPAKKQITLFSATMPPEAKKIIHSFLHTPKFITGDLHVDKSLLVQKAFFINQELKFSLLTHFLKNNLGSAIIFCRTKRDVDRIAKNLRNKDFKVASIHGDIVQTKRQHAINDFKENKIDFLIATDVAARGIDIKDVSIVYNFNIPKEITEYTHRIGRTARAGKKGLVINIVSDRDEEINFKKIIKSGQDIKKEENPKIEKIKFLKFDSRGRGLSRGERRSGERGERNRKNSRNFKSKNKDDRKEGKDRDFKKKRFDKNRHFKNKEKNDFDSTKNENKKFKTKNKASNFTKKDNNKNDEKPKKKFYQDRKKKKGARPKIKKFSKSNFKNKIKKYKKRNKG